MKKLVISNAILAFLILSVFLLGYYFLRYPDEFDIRQYIRQAEWKSFGLVIFGLAVAAFALSFLPVRNYKQKIRGAFFLAILQGMFLSFLFFKMINTYKENKNQLERLLTEYREKAEADIKKGFIELEYTGGFELPNEQEIKMRAEIDSIRRQYGFSYQNSGCLISSDLIMAQEEYERLTRPFLEKRNGPNWEKRMEQQIGEIRNKYR